MQISGWILSAAVDTVRACAAVGLTRRSSRIWNFVCQTMSATQYHLFIVKSRENYGSDDC